MTRLLTVLLMIAGLAVPAVAQDKPQPKPETAASAEAAAPAEKDDDDDEAEAPAAAEGTHEAGTENVTGSLPCHQRNTQTAHDQRVMPRVDDSMESRNTATSGN